MLSNELYISGLKYYHSIINLLPPALFIVMCLVCAVSVCITCHFGHINDNSTTTLVTDRYPLQNKKNFK